MAEEQQDRSGVVRRMRERLEAMNDRATVAAAAPFGSDPVVAGVAGFAAKTVMNAVSKIGGAAESIFNRNPEVESPHEMNLNVDGEIQVNANSDDRQVERAPKEEPQQEESQVEQDKEAKSQAGLIERIVERTERVVGEGENKAAGLGALAFGSDPIVAAAIGGLIKGTGAASRKGFGMTRAGFERRRARKDEQSARERVRQETIENRQTKSLRKRQALQDSDITAAAASAAVEKMPSRGADELVGQKLTEVGDETNALVEKMGVTNEGLERLSSSVERIEAGVIGGMPTAQEKAQEKLDRERQLENEKNSEKILEKIAENTVKDDEKGMLEKLFDGLGLGGIGGLAGGLMGALTTTLPTLLMGALKKIPIVGFVVSAFKGLFDGVKAFMQGDSVMGAVMETITGFADSLIRVFSFGLLNLEKVQNMMEPAMNAIFDTFFTIKDGILSIVNGGYNILTSAAQSLFDGVSNVFHYVVDFVKSIPNKIVAMLPGPVRSVLGLSEEENEERTNRLQNQERTYIERVLERGEEQVGPSSQTVELTPERREVLERKLERIERGQTAEPINPVEQEINQRAAEESPSVSEYREMLPGRLIERERLIREQEVDSANDAALSARLAPIKRQMQSNQMVNARMSNMVQQNNNQSNIINPPGSLRKEDYFSGATNREVDWG